MSIKRRIRKIFGNKKTESPPVVPVVLPDPCEYLSFVRNGPFGTATSELGGIPENTINWVVPDVGIGGGGHLNIFRMASNLEGIGFDCRIVIDRKSEFPDGVAAKDFIQKHYLALQGEVFVGEHSMPPAWFTFATSWETAYTVRNFRSTHRKCYFVQDFEPLFFPSGSAAALAEQTYRFGFLGITSGGWLADKLARDYGMRTKSIGFSYDRGRYSPQPRESADGVQRIFFYARQGTPRRGFELGIMVLSEVAKRMPRVKIVLAGCDASIYRLPFEYTNSGIMALDDLPRLYSQCDAALVLSHTNLSLLPLELMACGCPVVSNRGANVEWLLSDDTAMLAENDVDALASAVVTVLTDVDRRQTLVSNGLALANNTDWCEEARRLAQYLREEQTD